MTSPESYEFKTRVVRVTVGTSFLCIAIPRAVSKAIGKRGPVPVIAVINGVAETRASIVPTGGGRHRLMLNAATRKLAGAPEGALAAVVLAVDESPVAEAIPIDLSEALSDAGVMADFIGLSVGRRNHILRFIEQSAHEATREKRVAMAVEVANGAREKGVDREMKKARKATTPKKTG